MRSSHLCGEDANDDIPVNFIWQSSDYPTHTLLPEIKRRLNCVTQPKVYVSSWKGSVDVGLENFTYGDARK